MHTIFSSPISTRRALLSASAGGLVSACATASSTGAPPSSVAQDLAAYAAFGDKNAGGAADGATGAWVEQRLAAAGFEIERQSTPALRNDVRRADLVAGEASLSLAVHDVADASGRIDGPLVTLPPVNGAFDNAGGAIVAAHLTHRRWSSALHPEIQGLVTAARDQHAAALVLITHGPTSELIRLNRTLDRGRVPVLLASPRAWSAAQLQSTATATLHLDAQESRIEAFNIVGRIDRSAAQWIVISTPRSGWGPCAGERGPGIAAFLAFAQWAPTAFPNHNLAFVCTSSHEFENVGGARFLEHGAPPPDRTALWLHLGAGFAARDWHEIGSRLLPLPSPDPQRFLMTSPALTEAARIIFAGAPGLETPYPTGAGAAGELQNIIAAGYPSTIGLFGAHRFHHIALDDMRCADPAHTQDVIVRLQQLALLATG